MKFMKKIVMLSLFLGFLMGATANADIVGDEIEASLTIDPDQSTFDENAISGTAIVIDPGREYQAEITSIPNGIQIDFFIDINDNELTFGFERTDSSNGNYGSGFGRTVSLSISDIDWTSNPIDVQYLSQSTFGDSGWEGDPAGFAVTTTSNSINVDFPSGYRLGGDGGSISATYAISSVPEPNSAALASLLVIGIVTRRRRTWKA